jgi:hypothetical protein
VHIGNAFSEVINKKAIELIKMNAEGGMVIDGEGGDMLGECAG